MKRKKSSLIIAAACAALTIGLGIFCPQPLQAQGGTPKFEVDPYWPKPLPDRWVTGEWGGVCVDAKDHVFVLNRRNLEDLDKFAGTLAPPVIEFDPEGNMVNSFGDPDVLPKSLHGCFVDRENNVWVAGAGDASVQKYTHDGSKLLLQIGTRGVFDTSDGTRGAWLDGAVEGRALNSSHTLLNQPSGVAVDRSNGDVYVSDGYGNSRVAVFDRNGQFLRQWGRQGTKAEAEAGVGGAFINVLHCVVIGNDGLVYVCDRQGDRVQVFDKMGTFQRNIWVRTGDPHLPDHIGTVEWVAFSPDQAQRFMYVGNDRNEVIHIFDHASGQLLSSFGRAGHQVGEGHPHIIAVDSKGNIFVAGTDPDRKLQKFKIVVSE